MAIEFNRKTINGSQPTIWRGEAKILPGGFKPLQLFPVGTILQRGLPLYVDFETMSAAVCKTATVLAGGTTTKVRVSKGHVFVVGDIIMKDGVTDESPAIDSIDTTNEGYDVLNLHSAITGITEGDIIVLATAYVAAQGTEGQEGYVAATPAAPKYTPNTVVGAIKEFNGKGLPAIDAAYEANVLYAHMPVPFLPAWIENGMCLKTNHSIKLIKQ